jgi:hypothetical protein
LARQRFQRPVELAVFLGSALKEMSAAAVAAVEADALGCLQGAGRVAQARSGRLEQHVVVVRHQTVGVDYHAEPLDGLLERFQEPLPLGTSRRSLPRAVTG